MQDNGPILNKHNVLNATIIATIAGIELACVLFAPQYPKECAIIGTVVGAWATTLRLPIPGMPAGASQPIVRTQNIENVNVAPQDEPPKPSVDHTNAYVVPSLQQQRDTSGRYVKVDTVSDH